MSTYAKFPSEKAAKDFVAKIDAAYGFPNKEATTYAVPTENKDGTWSVKIKPWLKADIGQSRKWCVAAAVSECAKLVTVAEKPEPKDEPALEPPKETAR